MDILVIKRNVLVLFLLVCVEKLTMFVRRDFVYGLCNIRRKTVIPPNLLIQVLIQSIGNALATRYECIYEVHLSEVEI